MATAALATYNFAGPITLWIGRSLTIVILAVELLAFVHCATQRADAFAVVGNLSKGGWLALTGGVLLFSLLVGFFSLFALIVVAASLVYLLDVRPALRDAVDGHGSW
jgi:hypothetical protein